MLVSEVPMAAARSTTGRWFLVLAGTLWGTGGLTGSLLARTADLAAPAVATFRLGVGGLLIVAVLAFLRRPLPRGRLAWTRIAVLGLLAAGFQASYFAAVAASGVSLATLVSIGASPVLVLLAEAVTGRRRPGPRQLATAALALAGLTLLIGVPSGGRDLTATLIGAGFALLAAAGFATMTFVGSSPVDGLDDLTATGFAFTLGAAALAPLAMAGSGLAFTPEPATLGLLLLFGAGPTAIAYAAYFRGLRTTSAGTAALMALLEPLVGTALAVLLLGDRLSPAGMAGAVVLIGALVLDQRGGRDD
jgi:DME family drug/metabolite transporter